MNKSTFLANIATLMQLQWEILKSTKIHCMKISKCLVHIEATTKGSFAKDHVGVIYPCKLCSYKVTQKGELKEHQKLIHEGVKYIFKHCSYEATIIRNKCTYEAITNGSLAKHQKEGHEGVKYPCKHCSYKGT